MSDGSDAASNTPALTVSELLTPEGISEDHRVPRTDLTPEQRVFFYSSDEWECFIRECATALSDRYVSVKRLGGTNDEGIDVAGFASELGFEGVWDCWQGKHYAGSLVPSDAMPEILKVLLHFLNGDYNLPRAYYFLAPQGCGPSLSRLLSKPSKLRAHFIDCIQDGNPLARGLNEETLSSVRVIAAQLDFSLFKSIEMQDLVELHSCTAWHNERFGVPLKPRPVGFDDAPTKNIEAKEARYVEKLISVYRKERLGGDIDVTAVLSDATLGPHFHRQRVAFFSAEGLRAHTRDSVPPGTFEALQDDVFDGVIDTAEAYHPSGLERLQQVMAASGQIDLGAHALIKISKVRDRHGICHQLANEDRLGWLEEKP